MGLKTIEEYAVTNNIPIMQKDGMEFIINFLKENHYLNHILEIGTAIGYSAINMALIRPNIKITTIERDIERYEEAIKNIKELNLESQITCHLMDAFDFQSDEIYDLIFIDAAKSQSIKFFEKFAQNLSANGFIITDNLDFHGYVTGEIPITSKNVNRLVTKIKDYIYFLETNSNYHTTFHRIGDGISVSTPNKTKS